MKNNARSLGMMRGVMRENPGRFGKVSQSKVPYEKWIPQIEVMYFF
jgi:hypothetical protein